MYVCTLYINYVCQQNYKSEPTRVYLDRLIASRKVLDRLGLETTTQLITSLQPFSLHFLIT